MKTVDAPPFSFLMSSERSGSNLLTRMVGAHPEFCAPSPAHLFRLLAQNLFRYGTLTEDDDWSALISDTVRLAECQVGTWVSRPNVCDLQAKVSERSLGALLSAVYAMEAKAQGRQRLFVKENHIYEYFGFLAHAFPKARYVYLARDPRDMALSWKQSTALRGGVVRAAKTWQRDQQGFLRMVSWLSQENLVFTLRYEELVSNARELLRELCGFLDVSYSDSMLEFHQNALAQQDAANVADWQNIATPILSENFGKYQSALSDAELYFIEAICHQECLIIGKLW